MVLLRKPICYINVTCLTLSLFARLPVISVLGLETLNVSTDALREAEDVQLKVLAMTSKISDELRARITELQSFSPDELGNIPRRCKYFCIFTALKNEN